MYKAGFSEQAKIVIQCLSLLPKIKCFALKGGTAINMFIRDMPRLSVDIDLTYIPLASRKNSLSGIEKGLLLYKKLIEDNLGFDVDTIYNKADQSLLKLMVYENNTPIKIEPNTIVRGTLHMVDKRDLSSLAAKTFRYAAIDIPVLSMAELYAGKICAALDRQHPRDLFDIKLLYEHESLTDEIRQAFLVYLISHPRPISELLSPNLLNIENSFRQEFSGMTLVDIELDELLAVREELIYDINKQLTNYEREFLLSIKQGEPKWELLPFPNLDKLPAVIWKLMAL